MNDQDKNSLLDLLGSVDELLSQSVEGRLIFDALGEGALQPAEAMTLLAEVVRKENLLPELLEAAEQFKALVPVPGNMTPESLGAADRPMMMQTSTGIPRLNPVYEAAIAERVALDGDAPELRSGPLPKRETPRPAVPVITTSRDPVVVGLMLERASNEVGAQLQLANKEHAVLCQKLLEAAGDAALAEGKDVTTALTIRQETLPARPTGVKDYEAGSFPALRAVTPPDPHVTAVVDERLRRVAIYNVIAKTQGRVSVAPVIEAGVRSLLEREGVSILQGEVDENSAQFEAFSWTMQVFGPEDLSDKFNPIEAAIAQLAAQCVRKVQMGREEHPKGEWAVQVHPYNEGISRRRFGWNVRIGPGLEKP